jgi:DNA (cytosine-5)-methyltransferase 1
MSFASLCDGISAARVAWLPMGWDCLWAAEIDPRCNEVLRHHYPQDPNYGDITGERFGDLLGCVERPNVLIAGTPCQSFSVAGLRRSLADSCGNLTLRFVEIGDELDPDWIVWENVPGVLSTVDNAFGCLLGALVGAGKPLWPGPRHRRFRDAQRWRTVTHTAPNGATWTDLAPAWPEAGVAVGPRRSLAWRVLDAQHFGLAQRRRRVLLVARRAGDGAAPAAVLFEPDSLPGNPPSRRTARAGVAQGLTSSPGGCSGKEQQHTFIGESGPMNQLAFGGNNSGGPIDVATACNAHGGTGRHDFESETFVTHTLRGEGADASEDGTGRGTPLVPVYAGAGATSDMRPCLAVDYRNGLLGDDVAGTLEAAMDRGNRGQGVLDSRPESAVAISGRARGDDGRGYERADHYVEDRTHTLDAVKQDRVWVPGCEVRRLTPRECERLQGFPDDYTLVPSGAKGTPMADGPRYRMLGNSMAVPVIRWIGQRIERVHRILNGGHI